MNYFKEFAIKTMNKYLQEEYKNHILIQGNDFEPIQDAVVSFLNGATLYDLSEVGKYIGYDDLGAVVDLIADESDYLLNITNDKDIDTIFEYFPSIADELELATPEHFLKENYDENEKCRTERRL